MLNLRGNAELAGGSQRAATSTLRPGTTKDKNRALIGREIEIWWPGDERFYPGRIVKFQARSNLHRVVYNDGDVESLDLSTEHWRFIDTCSPPANMQDPRIPREPNVRLQPPRVENKALRRPQESLRQVQQRPLSAKPIIPYPMRTSPVLAGVQANLVSSSQVMRRSSASSSPAQVARLRRVVGHVVTSANRAGQIVGTVPTSLSSSPARASTPLTSPPAGAPPPLSSPLARAPTPLSSPPARAPTPLPSPPVRAPTSSSSPPAKAPTSLSPPPARAPTSLSPPPARAPTPLSSPPARAPAPLSSPPARVPGPLSPPPARVPAPLPPPPARAPALLSSPSARAPTSLSSPPTRRPQGPLQTEVQRFPKAPGAAVAGRSQEGQGVSRGVRSSLVQLASPIYKPQEQSGNHSRTGAAKSENILMSPLASPTFARGFGTPPTVMPLALANDHIVPNDHIVAQGQRQTLSSPGATRVNPYAPAAQANRIHHSIPRNNKQQGGPQVAFTGNVSDSLGKSRDGVRRASTGAVQAGTARGGRELRGPNFGSASMKNDLAKFPVRRATNLTPSPQNFNSAIPVTTTRPAYVASGNTSVQVRAPLRTEPQGVRRARKIAPRGVSANVVASVPMASRQNQNLQRALQPTVGLSPVRQNDGRGVGGVTPPRTLIGSGVGELKTQVILQGKGNVTSDRMKDIPSKVRTPPALQTRPMESHKANVVCSKASVVCTGQATNSPPSTSTAPMEICPTLGSGTSSKGIPSSVTEGKKNAAPKQLEKAVRNEAIMQGSPNVVIPISKPAAVNTAKERNIGGTRNGPPVSPESLGAKGSCSTESKSLESESEQIQEKESGSLLRKRSGPLSPAPPNKKTRQDELISVLQKLSENEKKQAARTDKVHSALLSGIASIRETVQPGDSSWMDGLVNAVVSRLQASTRFSFDALEKKLDKHVAALSSEIKEIRKDIGTKFAHLQEKSRKTEDDVRSLKNELALFKESIKEEVTGFTTTLNEKLAQYSGALQGAYAPAPNSPIVISIPNSPPITPVGRSRDDRMQQLSDFPGSNESGAASDHGSSNSRVQEDEPNDRLSVRRHSGIKGVRITPIPAHRVRRYGVVQEASLRRSIGPISMYPASHSPNGGTASPSGQNQRQPNNALGLPGHNTVTNRSSPHDNEQEVGRREREDQIRRVRQSKIKQKAKAIVARAVTIWLLETDHHCSTYDHASWVQQTSAKCLRTVVDNNLRRFDSGEQALNILSVSLGTDLVRLEWFTCRATPHNLALARRNYDPWDPPPKDDEWNVEELLLREISERYFLAECAHSFDNNPDKGSLEIAIDICSHAASPDIYKVITDSPTGLIPGTQRLYICKRLGYPNVYGRFISPPGAGWAVCRVEDGELIEEDVPGEGQ